AVWMELHSQDKTTFHGAAELAGVLRQACDHMGPRWYADVGVDEVEVRIGLHARPHGRAVGSDLVPADVWHFDRAAQQSHRPGNEPKAGRVSLFAPLKQELHAETETEQGPPRCR